MFEYFDAILHQILLVIADNIGDGLIAIIILGILTKAIIFPATHLAEQLRKIISIKKEKMKADLSALKILQGISFEERYHRREKIYKLHDYNPSSEIFMSCLILVQIPVMILSMHSVFTFDWTPFPNFLSIIDLGKTDQLIKISDQKINIFPILMGCICSFPLWPVQSIYYPYSAILLTLAYIIVFYTMPVSLIIFWTTLNTLSLIQRIVSDKGWRNFIDPPWSHKIKIGHDSYSN